LNIRALDFEFVWDFVLWIWHFKAEPCHRILTAPTQGCDSAPVRGRCCGLAPVRETDADLGVEKSR
jgi:hypothetical protein